MIADQLISSVFMWIGEGCMEEEEDRISFDTFYTCHLYRP